MDRRKFITSTVGLSLLSGYPIYSIPGKERKLGVALVGLGAYSTSYLGPAIKNATHTRLIAVVTGNKMKGQSWAAEYNFPEKNIYSYENFMQIADNKDIDIVYIVLPNSMHAEYTIKAAQCGKHVICEKPMATSVSDAIKMIETCRKYQVKLSIGYRLHTEPNTQEIIKIAQNKQFGNVLYGDVGFGFKIGTGPEWRLNKEMAGGGALMDVGIYAIQAACYATNEQPISVLAQEFKTLPDKFNSVDESISWQFEYASGAIVTGFTSYNAQLERLYVSTTDGWYTLNPAYRHSKIKGLTHQSEIALPNINQQQAHIDDFAISINNNLPIRTPGEMGLRDLVIIEAIYKSASTGRKIPIAYI